MHVPVRRHKALEMLANGAGEDMITGAGKLPVAGAFDCKSNGAGSLTTHDAEELLNNTVDTRDEVPASP